MCRQEGERLLSESASGSANSSYTPSTYQMKFINNAKPTFKILKSMAHAINRNWDLSVTGYTWVTLLVQLVMDAWNAHLNILCGTTWFSAQKLCMSPT
jgi:hypothetical protein